MSLPPYLMGQQGYGAINWQPAQQGVENILARLMRRDQMQQDAALQQQRMGMEQQRLGMDERRLGFEEAMHPERLNLLRQQIEAQRAQAGLTPLQRQQLEANIAQTRAQTEALTRKDSLEQFLLNQFKGDQPAAPAPSPVRPQSYAPTPERPAIMTPAAVGVAPQEPAGDPMLIRTQAAPGQQPIAPDDPIVEVPGMGKIPRSQAQKLGMLLAIRGKGDAGKMIMDAAKPGQLPKEALNEIGKTEINLTESLGRMREITRQFRPEFLTFEEQAKQYGISWLDKFDATRSKLTPEQIQQHAQYTAFRRDTVDNLNRYIKEITGAAMGVEEAKRIISAQPNMDDGPTAFIAKVKATQRAAELAVARTRFLRQNGFNGQPWNGDVEAAARAVPLERMKSIILEDSKQTLQQIRQQFPQGDPAQIQGAVRAHIRAKYGMDI